MGAGSRRLLCSACPPIAALPQLSLLHFSPGQGGKPGCCLPHQLSTVTLIHLSVLAVLTQPGCPLPASHRSAPQRWNFRLNRVGISMGLAAGFGRQLRFCKAQSLPAPGPSDPRSSSGAVNHLFWFLLTRLSAAVPGAEAVGVREMHNSRARASAAGHEKWYPTGPPALPHHPLLVAAIRDCVWVRSSMPSSPRDEPWGA